MSIVIDIEGVDFEKSNVIFVNGMTLEKVKIKYNWLLNAKVKDAIVGEDSRGLVWYFGDWYCGEWYDGTWYSGNFYDGLWKNGLWYSYDLNKFDVINENFFIKQTGDIYSHFHNGVWLNGTFFRGTFGVNSGETWIDYELYTGNTYPTYRIAGDIIGGQIQYTEKNLATWIDGIFQDGLFYDAIWKHGRHINGYFENSKWIYGLWYNGTFNGHTWHNGNWYNGQFINGEWLNGTFTKLNENVISRFGNTLLNTTDNSAICNWYNGTWKNGEWFSGYLTDANKNPIKSKDNYLSIWHDGTWFNGIWYGGHFKKGEWKNGIWKNGIFGFLKSTSWVEPQLVSVRDNYEDLLSIGFGDRWSGDTISPTLTTDSDLVTASNTANTSYETVYYDQTINIDVSSIVGDKEPNSYTNNSGKLQVNLPAHGYYVDDIILFTQTNLSYNNKYSKILSGNTNNFTVDLDYVSNTMSGSDKVTKVSGGITVDPSYSSITFKHLELINVPFQAYGNDINKTVPFGYNFSEIDEWNEYKVYIKNATSSSYFNVSTMITGSTITGSTNSEWIMTLDSWNSGICNSAMTSMDFIIKRKIKLDSGNGTGMTFWEFNEHQSYTGTIQSNWNIASTLNPQFVSYIGTIKPEFVVGDYVYVEQTPGYVNEQYNSVCEVIATGGTNGSYSVTTSQKYRVVKSLITDTYSTHSGKIVKYLGLYGDRLSVDTNSIFFQDFNFDFDFILNTATTLVNGYSIKFDTDIVKNGCNNNGYRHNLVWLPLKKLTLEKFTGTNPNYYSNDYDTAYYNSGTITNPIYKYNGVYDDIEIGKNKNIQVTNKLDGTQQTNYYGGLDDMWGMNGLEDYYYYPETYNPTLVSTAISQMRIGIKFYLDGTINQQLYLSNIQIKAYYSNEDEIPIWRNGTWQQGTWYNGDFYDGTFKSGMWLKGNFYGGSLASGYR